MTYICFACIERNLGQLKIHKKQGRRRFWIFLMTKPIN
jgi:hypothetical protein